MSSKPSSPQKEPSVPWRVQDTGLLPHMDTSVRTKTNISGDNTAELQGHIKPWEHRELSEQKV